MIVQKYEWSSMQPTCLYETRIWYNCTKHTEFWCVIFFKLQIAVIFSMRNNIHGLAENCGNSIANTQE